jgi:signal transduction histidine kinase
VLDSVFATVEPIAAQKNQTVTLFLCEEPMWTDGDSIRLHQVFVNLLSNAVRYTPDGGRIHLTATAAPEALTIEVADSGQGMSAKELPEIFKPFVRGDSSEGLGIGLALVNGIVELHGGVIRARSAGRDCGSRFTVTLPRRGAPRGH